MLAQRQANSGTNLIRALRTARRSWWCRSLVDAMLAGLLVAGSASVIGWIRAWIVGETGSLYASGGGVQTLVIAAGSGSLLWLVIAIIRSPSLLDIARRVDRLLDQSERFSTTYEVLSAGKPTSVVTDSLLAQVEERAERLDVGPAGWRREDRWLSRAAAAATLVGTLMILISVPGRPPTIETLQAPVTAADSPGQSEESATLASVADLLQLVAEQENNDYLRAVADSFSDLAERVGSGSLSVSESERQVRELTAHLQAAALDVGGRFSNAVAEALEPVSDAINTDAASSSDTAPMSAPASADDNGALEAVSTAEATTSDFSSSLFSSLNALMDQFDADPTSVGVRPSRRAPGDSEADNFYGGVLDAQTDPNAAAPQQQGLGRAEGQARGAPAGAAAQSSDAAGDAAGQGGADLGLNSDSYLDLVTHGGNLAALQPNQRDDGKFVEMELVPKASDPSAAQGTGLAHWPAAFVRADESALTTRSIGTEHAAVVSRYFTPGSVPPVGAP